MFVFWLKNICKNLRLLLISFPPGVFKAKEYDDLKKVSIDRLVPT